MRSAGSHRPRSRHGGARRGTGRAHCELAYVRLAGTASDCVLPVAKLAHVGANETDAAFRRERAGAPERGLRTASFAARCGPFRGRRLGAGAGRRAAPHRRAGHARVRHRRRAPAGDHWIVVGQVENIRISPVEDPLVFFVGAFGGQRPARRQVRLGPHVEQDELTHLQRDHCHGRGRRTTRRPRRHGKPRAPPKRCLVHAALAAGGGCFGRQHASSPSSRRPPWTSNRSAHRLDGRDAKHRHDAGAVRSNRQRSNAVASPICVGAGRQQLIGQSAPNVDERERLIELRGANDRPDQ